MSQLNLPTPPTLTGSEQNQITVLKDYLFRMSRMLNDAVNGLDLDNFSRKSIVRETISQSQETTKSLMQRAESLKALIISTAHTIMSIDEIMDKILTSEQFAQSIFGTYKRKEEGHYTFDASKFSGDLSKEEWVTDLSVDYDKLHTVLYGTEGDDDDVGALIRLGALEAYKITNEANFKLGWVTMDGEDVVGLALGQKFMFEAASNPKTIDGVTYEPLKLTETQAYGALYTSKGIQFYVDGNPVAEFRLNDNKTYYLYSPLVTANKLTLTGNLEMAPWRIDQSNGFSILYMGAGD